MGQSRSLEVELPISLKGGDSFPQILFHDPDAGTEPRQCEACHRMAEPSGGQKDLDGCWSCRKCVTRQELLGWRPRAASGPQEVTDCLTVASAQLALALLVGRRSHLSRRAAFPNGWYGLHVAKGADEQLADWPTVPAEQDLPHQAVVGLLEVCAEGSDWPRKYRIIKTMALKDSLPGRSPGMPQAPWRLSPALRRRALELQTAKVFENPQHIADGESSTQSWWNWDDWSGGWTPWSWSTWGEDYYWNSSRKHRADEDWYGEG
ncbi:unnamed protein product [Effrenium voratum]|nr:unnamed protein product [Effrenium voratum]